MSCSCGLNHRLDEFPGHQTAADIRAVWPETAWFPWSPCPIGAMVLDVEMPMRGPGVVRGVHRGVREAVHACPTCLCPLDQRLTPEGTYGWWELEYPEDLRLTPSGAQILGYPPRLILWSKEAETKARAKARL